LGAVPLPPHTDPEAMLMQLAFRPIETVLITEVAIVTTFPVLVASQEARPLLVYSEATLLQR
jgi:hypothetical protein